MTDAAKRNAVVFVPGMGDDYVNQSIQAIGARLAHSLNRSAMSAKTKFSFEFEVREKPFGPGVNASACTITFDPGDGPQPCLDLFKVDAVRTLRAQYEGWSLLRRMVVPLVFVLLYLRGVVSAFQKRAGKTRRERYQLFFAIFVMLLMTGYVVALVLAAVETLDDSWIPWISAGKVQGLVLALTGLGLWKSKFVSSLGRGAVGYTCVIGYLGFGNRRDQLVGQLIQVLDQMQEQDVEYERIDVIAYSFGTLVALDAFFPGGGPANIRLGKVNTFVTIGCPFDFVRTYWPSYFDGRNVDAKPGTEWLNFYSPVDILASNFRGDGEIGPPEWGIPTDAPTEGQCKPTNAPYGTSQSVNDIGPVQFLTFLGLRSHSLYWGREDEREVSVFDQIVTKLYAGQPFMN